MAQQKEPGAAVDLPDLPSLFVTRIDARTFCLKAGVLVALLVLAHVVYALCYWREGRPDWLEFRLVGMWDLDEEESFGTYYSALMLLFIGRLLWHHGRRVQRAGGPLTAWWLVLAVGFHLLSIDEIVALHEILNSHLKDQAESLAAAERWTTYAKYLVAVVGLAYLPFLWRLRWRTAVWMAAGGVLYVLGAVGVEAWADRFENQDRLDTLEYNLWTAVEEALEMIGPLLFLHALLAHVAGGARGTVTAATRVEATAS